MSILNPRTRKEIEQEISDTRKHLNRLYRELEMVNTQDKNELIQKIEESEKYKPINYSDEFDAKLFKGEIKIK